MGTAESSIIGPRLAALLPSVDADNIMHLKREADAVGIG